MLISHLPNRTPVDNRTPFSGYSELSYPRQRGEDLKADTHGHVADRKVYAFSPIVCLRRMKERRQIRKNDYAPVTWGSLYHV